MPIQHITILHSNDIHADYFPREEEGILVGGIAYLGGYIDSVRTGNEESTLYLFAGDMYTGSVIDVISDGESTQEIMNILDPDVATVGNHEFDYTLACLDYFKNVFQYPFVCANIYDKRTGKTFFNSHKIIPVNGIKVLVIGITTKEVMTKAAADKYLDEAFKYEQPEGEITKILEEEKGKYDLSIVLSHIGEEKDLELADKLGKHAVDIIIGGHSHTKYDQEKYEETRKDKGINIVQVGKNSTQIGQFEIDYDTDTHKLVNCEWKLVKIETDKIKPNAEIDKILKKWQEKLENEGYFDIVSTVKLKTDAGKAPSDATHPSRYMGTEVGNLFCDALRELYELDVVIIGSGSLREEIMKKDVSKASLIAMYPFKRERFIRINMTGEELKALMEAMLSMCPDPKDKSDHHEEFLQISQGFKFVFSKNKPGLIEATFNGNPIDDKEVFSVGLEAFQLSLLGDRYKLSNVDEIKKREKDGIGKYEKKPVLTSMKNYISQNKTIPFTDEKRVVVKEYQDE